jgi:hypothetical protein
MDIESTVKTIRSLYQTLSGKNDVEISLTYKGTGWGLGTPWQVRVGDRECLDTTHEAALTKLFGQLKQELAAKTKSAENEAARLRQALNQLGN